MIGFVKLGHPPWHWLPMRQAATRDIAAVLRMSQTPQLEILSNHDFVLHDNAPWPINLVDQKY